MARVKGALMTRKRRNKVLKAAKGYWGSKSKHFKMAKQAVMKSGNYAFTGRKLKKRDFRRLWITRISAEAKVNGINYSQFMNGLKKAGVTLNRKMLSEIAVADKAAFASLVAQANPSNRYDFTRMFKKHSGIFLREALHIALFCGRIICNFMFSLKRSRLCLKILRKSRRNA